jgi:hypothetical protein
LTSFERPLQARLDNWTASTYSLCFFNLKQSWASIADGEEEFWIFVAADCLMAPVHWILQVLDSDKSTQFQVEIALSRGLEVCGVSTLALRDCFHKGKR